MSLDDIHNFGVDVSNRVIYTHSEFDPEEAYLDFRMAVRFIKNLDYLKSLSGSEPIRVKIASYGGCWNYGIAMYDAIMKARENNYCKITTVSYAHARSMSSIVPQAATWRVIAPTADFMVHYGTQAMNEVDYRTAVGIVQTNIRSTEKMLDIYASRCVNGEYFVKHGYSLQETKDFIKDKIDKNTDWYLTPKESVYYGFMDEVM
jgi:ATP-dependent protease ClpP protease subunit